MNEFKAKVTKISGLESLHIVKFDTLGTFLFMMSLELPNVKEGMDVLLGVKSTSITLAKDFSGKIGFSNKLKGKILEIERSDVLCSITLETDGVKLETFMTRHAFKHMEITEGDEVDIFIKASELSIKEVL